jgi:energy-coupling factor transporter transmembrane protein EcfT
MQENGGPPGGFFFLFGILRFLPYIAIGLLVIAIAIWIVFALKKLKWAKIVAIVFTVLTVIFGSLSVVSIFTGRSMTGGRMGPPQGAGEGFQRPENGKNNSGGNFDNAPDTTNDNQ